MAKEKRRYECQAEREAGYGRRDRESQHDRLEQNAPAAMFIRNRQWTQRNTRESVSGHHQQM
jgi:hypothetical protein